MHEPWWQSDLNSIRKKFALFDTVIILHYDGHTRSLSTAIQTEVHPSNFFFFLLRSSISFLSFSLSLFSWNRTVLITTVQCVSERFTRRFRCSIVSWSINPSNQTILSLSVDWYILTNYLEGIWLSEKKIYDLYSSVVMRAEIRKSIVNRSFLSHSLHGNRLNSNEFGINTRTFLLLSLPCLLTSCLRHTGRLFVRVNPYRRVNKSRFVSFDEEFARLQKRRLIAEHFFVSSKVKNVQVTSEMISRGVRQTLRVNFYYHRHGSNRHPFSSFLALCQQCTQPHHWVLRRGITASGWLLPLDFWSEYNP